ncbi:hypothetical protein, partial [Falsiroseomonas sp. E2-1-a20]|uniref:hypothetical protein n=1 Tax=Falsiroseomonas sp. E2-1-a20 TaxID=3239300 RepID=UPI003F336176
MAGRCLDSAQRDQARAAIDRRTEIVGVEAATAEWNLPDVVAARLELSPGKVVGALLLCADHQVFARRRAHELGGNQACGGADRGDEGDMLLLLCHLVVVWCEAVAARA